MIVEYTFGFEDKQEKCFTVEINPETLDITPSPKMGEPEWAKLDLHSCSDCRLDKKGETYCPVAVKIYPIVEFFKTYKSYEEALVTVRTEERLYQKKTSVQRALSSLLGIYMAAGGCPSLEMLKPMVRFHLPFATFEETLYRSVSSYLLGQYFLRKQGHKADIDLVELSSFYQNIQVVNKGVTERIRRIIGEDAVNNALICLDTFAKEMPNAIEESLEELEALFAVYLAGKEQKAETFNAS